MHVQINSVVTNTILLQFCFYSHVQKLQERIIVLQWSSLPSLEKEKWAKVLIPEMISGEDDNDDEDEDVCYPTTPLAFNSCRQFLQKPGCTFQGPENKASSVADESRILGAPSSHPKPPIPKWAFVVGM